METLRVERGSGVVTNTLDRPAVEHAMTHQLDETFAERTPAFEGRR